MRLIDADKAIEILNENQVEGDEFYKGLGKAKSILMEQPTVEVAKKSKPILLCKWRNEDRCGMYCNGFDTDCENYKPYKSVED